MMRFAKRLRSLPIKPLRRWIVTNILALVALVMISAIASHGASAQTQPAPGTVLGNCPTGGVLNALPGLYCNATLNWLSNGLQAAQRFFFILVGIELAWSALLWTLQKESLGELVTAFILKLMGIFFFYALLLFGSSWLPSIMQSFIGLAAQVTGQAQISLDPMTVFNLGTAICNEIFANLPHPGFDFNPLHLLPLPVIAIVNDLLSWYFFEIVFVFACIICFVVFLSFLIAAGQLIMTLIEAYIMIGAGAVMLGFTGSRWTMSFGEKWIGYAFSIGVKLFVIYVIVALGVTIFPANCPSGNDMSGICTQLQAINGTALSIDITNFNTTTFNISTIFTAYLEIAGAAIIFMMLCQRLPGLAASMMNGSPSLTMGAALATAMQVSGAITGVVKAGAGAAMGMPPIGGGSGGGLMEAASVDAGVGDAGGGSMSVTGSSLGSDGGGRGFGGDTVGGSMSPGGTSALGSGVGLTVSSNGTTASGGVGSTATANGASAGGGIGSSATPSGGSKLANGLVGAASSAASPLLNFDEGAGAGGGSVHIGLKLPE